MRAGNQKERVWQLGRGVGTEVRMRGESLFGVGTPRVQKKKEGEREHEIRQIVGAAM